MSYESYDDDDMLLLYKKIYINLRQNSINRIYNTLSTYAIAAIHNLRPLLNEIVFQYIAGKKAFS